MRLQHALRMDSAAKLGYAAHFRAPCPIASRA
ncbi:hypothetical protein FIU97_11715 [Roseivivax sp. THAF40]|nr:hypothetical protein FIV09_11725 [Roseivivax sp. THAF197b]QFT47243.1 hypothetical protein FIU97_11715 [Roseivivax sp. THAF40]